MIQKVVIVLVFLGAIIGGALYFDSHTKEESVNPYTNSLIETDIFQNQDGTFGYDVLIDGSVYVHQPAKPAVSGTSGFSDEAAAQKVADLVVSKIKNNILPPSVSSEELTVLGVI